MSTDSWVLLLAIFASVTCTIAIVTLGPWKEIGDAASSFWKYLWSGSADSAASGATGLDHGGAADAPGRARQPLGQEDAADLESAAGRLAQGTLEHGPGPPHSASIVLGVQASSCCTASPVSEVPYWLRKLARGPSDETAGAQLLEECQAGECVVCFEPLWRAGASIMRGDNGQRICPHYLCDECCSEMLERDPPTCPICRIGARDAYCDRVPDPRENPMGWFSAMDVSGRGILNRQQVSFGLEATLPLSRGRLQEALDAPCPSTSSGSENGSSQGSVSSSGANLWQAWCGGNKDGIRPEALTRKGGLLQWVYEHLGELGLAEGGAEDLDVSAEVLATELKTCPEAWFERFNINGTASLSRGEVLRAMMRTFAVSSLEKVDVHRLRARIRDSWRTWDPNNVGQVTLHEFLAPGGLYEDLLQLLKIGETPRECMKAELSKSMSLEKDFEPRKGNRHPKPDKANANGGKAKKNTGKAKEERGRSKRGTVHSSDGRSSGRNPQPRAKRIPGSRQPAAGAAAGGTPPAVGAGSEAPSGGDSGERRQAAEIVVPPPALAPSETPPQVPSPMRSGQSLPAAAHNNGAAARGRQPRSAQQPLRGETRRSGQS